MKKAFLYKTTLLFVFLSVFALSLSAQQKKYNPSRFGLKGGINFSSITNVDLGDIDDNMNSKTGFNVGLTYQYRLPFWGMAIQPELTYVSKGAKFIGESKLNIDMDYIELPINIQIGFDLIMMRPFIQVTPYVSYAIYNKWVSDGTRYFDWKNLNRFDYGIGIGGGVDIWRMQISARYSWGFADVLKSTPEGVIDTSLGNLIKELEDGSFRGLEISLYYFF